MLSFGLFPVKMWFSSLLPDLSQKTNGISTIADAVINKDVQIWGMGQGAIVLKKTKKTIEARWQWGLSFWILQLRKGNCPTDFPSSPLSFFAHIVEIKGTCFVWTEVVCSGAIVYSVGLLLHKGIIKVKAPPFQFPHCSSPSFKLEWYFQMEVSSIC